MNYPKRGEKSADGKLYTDNNGGVHESIAFSQCCDCSLWDDTGDVDCGMPCGGRMMFRRIEAAYVQTDDVLAACDMARHALRTCNFHATIGCENCGDFAERSCPARAYLAQHKQLDAWEVKT